MADDENHEAGAGRSRKTARNEQKAREREERLAKALRDNLRRRKQQIRGRDGAKPEDRD